MVFIQKSYQQEKFKKIVLTDFTIDGIEFDDCEFKDCNFVNCKFDQCQFYSCRFINCSLSAVTPTDSRLVDVTFDHSKVIGIDWTKAQSIQDLSFLTCQINYSNFRQLKLPNLKIIDCEAKEIDFYETDLFSGDFHDTDFTQSVFHKTNLTKCNFEGAKNYFIDPRSNTIKKAMFNLPEALSLLQGFDITIT